jgi:hypothetical protein
MSLVNLGCSILNLDNVTRIVRADKGQDVVVQFVGGQQHTYFGDEGELLWRQVVAQAERSPAALLLTSAEWAALATAGELILHSAAGDGPYIDALRGVVYRMKGGR